MPKTELQLEIKALRKYLAKGTSVRRAAQIPEEELGPIAEMIIKMTNILHKVSEDEARGIKPKMVRIGWKIFD